jgi:hypothetical protein
MKDAGLGRSSSSPRPNRMGPMQCLRILREDPGIVALVVIAFLLDVAATWLLVAK